MKQNAYSEIWYERYCLKPKAFISSSSNEMVWFLWIVLLSCVAMEIVSKMLN